VSPTARRPSVLPNPITTMNEANIIFAILAIAFALRFAWLELSGQ
jgi:hypothetical protein